MKQAAYDLLKEKGTFTLKDLFSVCLGKIFSDRIEFCEYIAGYKHWDVDIVKGELFVDDKKFNVECIGTSSTRDGMWFSAELERQIPDDKVSMIIESRNLIKRLNLENLAQTKIKLDNNFTDEKLAIIYTAFYSNPNCTYFIASPEDLRIFLHVKDFDGEDIIKNLTKPIPSHKFIPRVMEIISKYDVNHMLMIKSFLIHNDCNIVESTKAKITALFGDKAIDFTFDEKGNFASVNGQLG